MEHLRYLGTLLALALLVSCNKQIKIGGHLDHDVAIYPDYKDVTIPVNIAPLDFSVESSDDADYGVLIAGAGHEISVEAKDANFDIPQNQWEKLLLAAKGHSITLTVCKKQDGKWMAFRPFKMEVAPDSIDRYIAFRLIPPGYGLWNRMGIYQRDLENYERTPIMENKLTDNNCMNCHSFQMQKPDKMVFHMRAANGGTVYIHGKYIEKLNTKTPQTVSALVYPSWHPKANLIAFSTNKTAQAFFMNHVNRIEVFDSESDVVIYNADKHEVFSSPLLMKKDQYETFPTFSPDGKWLYFCSTAAVDSMPVQYKRAHYNLCRIAFDARTKTFGNQVEVVYNAERDSMSVSFPRISPNGKYLVFTRHHFGNFSIWHKDADLWMLNLQTMKAEPMTAANSNDVESYHSWSHNSKWLVFSSRRGDGLYTRPYFTYIDAQGKAHKPFLLPQRNPKKFYKDYMFSYNIPEMIMDKVKVNSHKIATIMRNSKGMDVTFRK